MSLRVLSRRTVLKLSLSLTGLLLFEGVRRYLGFEEAPAAPAEALLNRPEFYLPGSVTAVPEIRCWLVRDDAGFYALSSECTHLGCLVQSNDTGFDCPCHGSRFRMDGTVLNGPAATNLRTVQVSRAPDDRLIVNSQVTVPLGQRLRPVG